MFLYIEVAQVLRRYAASGRVEPGRCRDALDDMFDFPLDRYPHDLLLRRVWELQDNMTAYDAVYVALAEALDAPLLTRDRRLAAAAGHQARIELVRVTPAGPATPGDTIWSRALGSHWSGHQSAASLGVR